MTDWIAALPRQRAFWFGLAASALLLEGAALVYQYVLGYLPCVVCIQVRLLVAACLIVWLLAGAACRQAWSRGTALASSVGLSVFLAERSWQLLATENGWTVGSCEMTLGMPAWIAVDRWFPWLFEIHEPCGYTPYIVGKISMAEVLMGLSVLLSALFFALLVLVRLRPQRPL